MYVLIAGGGKVGANLIRSLLRAGHEVTLIEQKPYRFEKLEAEFEHQVIRGDATEVFVLERAGVKRPPDLLARPPATTEATTATGHPPPNKTAAPRGIRP